MCEHCGCRGVEPIAELMDEHYGLLDRSVEIRKALGVHDTDLAVTALTRLVRELDIHVRKEEVGVFAALRDQREFVDEVELLEGEHIALDESVRRLDPRAPDFSERVHRLLDELAEHVERENLGIFPVSVVTLNRDGWATVEAARQAHPTWLNRP